MILRFSKKSENQPSGACPSIGIAGQERLVRIPCRWQNWMLDQGFFSFETKKKSNIFVSAILFSSVSKIFSENFQIFTKNLQILKEKTFLRRKISKIFACGGLKIGLKSSFGSKQIEFGPNRTRMARFFLDRFFFRFTKTNKKHCAGFFLNRLGHTGSIMKVFNNSSVPLGIWKIAENQHKRGTEPVNETPAEPPVRPSPQPQCCAILESRRSVCFHQRCQMRSRRNEASESFLS